ncbi:oligosaccharide repeat unit polymerase, partial [bacterium]|nr:oligosaccharide repeat unit polymerase [bacterium]
MQKLDTRTSIIIIGIVFLVGVILCVVLFSMSDDLSALDFPLGFKFLFELIVYGISLFLFSNYKFKPTLWSKGFLIIVFFRFLFAIVVGLIVFLLFAKPPQNFGTVFIDALYRFNYSFILQVLFSPCLAYPLLNAVITEKVELEKAVKEASTKLRTSVPPPPPSTELPPEWIEDISTGEAGEIVEESSKSTKEISSELLKELGLSDLVEQQESEKTTSDKSDVEKTPTKKESSKSMDSDLKELLGQLDSKSFFEESGKSGSVKPKETEKPELDKQKPPDATQDLLDELAAFENSEGLKSIIPTEMPKIPESGIPEIKETAKSPLDRLSSKSEKSEVEKSVSELDDVLDLGLELPDFNIPGFEEEPEGKTEAEIKLPKFETESQKLESSKQKEQTRQPQEKAEAEIIPPKEVLPQPDVELQEEKPAEKPEEKNLELDINELLGE